tara:strand:+ start:127 stop:330 length:204 start_codon:yes stop_codon:yes gene_type:complete
LTFGEFEFAVRWLNDKHLSTATSARLPLFNDHVVALSTVNHKTFQGGPGVIPEFLDQIPNLQFVFHV